MEIPAVNVNYRIGVGKNSAHRTRENGQVPGVVYDANANKLIEIDKKTLESILTKYGENTLVNLQLGDETIKSMIMEVQHHPVNNQVIHVDFKPVQNDTRVRTHVPIRFIGTSEVKRNGAILQKQRQEIEVECVADKVPKYIEVDLSQLAVGQSFKVQDIEVAEELIVLTEPTEVLTTLTSASNYVEPEKSLPVNDNEIK
ncbi:MAG: large subunit ribosomal protein [Clostridiales bacterium]|nr:large subunit ribosomal protein [Clostridiales bacterium]MDK2932227.1 large subunit ribosomal protein [Clostridiales bacterium]